MDIDGPRRWFGRLRRRLDRTRADTAALAVAIRDPRTPVSAKLVAGVTLGLAASPIDPIPDFVPVLGYLDDAVFIPAGIYLAWRLTPENVKTAARETADETDIGWVKWAVAGLVVLGWGLIGYGLVRTVQVIA